MPESYAAEQALERAKENLRYYIKLAGNTKSLNLSPDAYTELDEIVDDIYEAAVAEIKHYIDNVDLNFTPPPSRWLTLKDSGIVINTDHVVNVKCGFFPTALAGREPEREVRVYLTDDTAIKVYYDSPDGLALRRAFGYDADEDFSDEP